MAAVRESLADAAAGNGPAPSGYGARVAANALAIVERELARGEADQRAYAALLARLGAADEAALAAEIRAGRRDHQLAEIAREFRAIVAARLAVAHPGYDTPLRRQGLAQAEQLGQAALLLACRGRVPCAPLARGDPGLDLRHMLAAAGPGGLAARLPGDGTAH